MKQVLRRGTPKDLGMMVAAASLGFLGGVIGLLSFFGIGDLADVRGGAVPLGAGWAGYVALYLIVFGLVSSVVVVIRRQLGGILLITQGIYSFFFLPIFLPRSFLFTLTATWILGGVLALLASRRNSRSMEENRAPKHLGMMVAAASLGFLGVVIGLLPFVGIGILPGVRGGAVPPGTGWAGYVALELIVFGVVSSVVVVISRQLGGILLITQGIYSFLFLPFFLPVSFLFTLTAASWSLGGVLALLGGRRGSRSMEEHRAQRK